MEAGLDSLGAVELRDTLASQFAVDVPATLVFDHPSAAAIAAFLSSRMSISQPPIPTRSAAATSAAGQSVGDIMTHFAAPAGPDKDEVVGIILGMLQELVGSQTQPSQPLMDAGLDSLGAVELRSSLSSRFSLDLPATAIFDYPSADALAAFIAKQLRPAGVLHAADSSGLEHYHSALDALQPSQFAADQQGHMSAGTVTHVTGISCRYPAGLSSVQGFWTGLGGCLDLPRQVPLARWDMDAVYSPEVGAAGSIYARFAACLDAIEMFDAAAFRMAPSESMATDPQVMIDAFFQTCHAC